MGHDTTYLLKETSRAGDAAHHEQERNQNEKNKVANRRGQPPMRLKGKYLAFAIIQRPRWLQEIKRYNNHNFELVNI